MKKLRTQLQTKLHLKSSRSLVSETSASTRSLNEDVPIPQVTAPAYQLVDPIAEGGYSQVHKARKFGSSSYAPKYAIKVCHMKHKQTDEGTTEQNQDDTEEPNVLTREELAQEVSILRHLQKSSYVIKMHDAFEVTPGGRSEDLWIVMDKFALSAEDVEWTVKVVSHLSKRGELSDKVLEKNCLYAKIPLDIVTCVILQVIQALKSLRKHRVVHLDIKPGNILLSSAGKIKLCDFGISRVIPKGQDFATVERVIGTGQYMASELHFRGQRFDYSADIWSLGVILFNLFTQGAQPYASKHDDHQRFKDRDWNLWAKSNESYFYNALGTRFLTADEYLKLRNERGSKTTREQLKTAKERHKEIAPIARIVRSAMIPQPKHGLHGEILREGLLDRLSLEEFEAWCQDQLVGISELGRVQRIMRLVEVTQAGESYLKQLGYEM